jgi:small subunit ribosomal protein S4
MGHPRKKRKKYSTPKHPWQAERLEKEKEILATYSLKNKKEIWKMQSVLKKYTYQAKKLANLKTEQAKKEKEQMINKLFKLSLIKKNADIDDVLGLTIKDILERRLQTIVYRKNMTNTPKQARQFIVHGHVFIGDRKVNIPSYLVKGDEEDKIKFKDNSPLIGKFGKEEEKEKTKKVEKKIVEKKEIKKKDKKPKERKKKIEDGKT